MTLILPQLKAGAPGGAREGRAEADEPRRPLPDPYSEERFAKFTELAADVLSAPIATIVIMEDGDPVTKSSFGFPIDALLHEFALVEQTMLSGDLLIVENMPGENLVPLAQSDASGIAIGSFAGAVILDAESRPAGALCVVDTKTREFTPQQLRHLSKLAELIEHELHGIDTEAELRRRIREHVLVDAATHLPTEGLFVNRLTRRIEQPTPAPHMIAMLRLERFEAIHSAVGKPGAAFLVREAAMRLQQALGTDCLIGQIREDAIVLGFALEEHASSEGHIHKLLQCFRAPFVLGEHRLAQIVSIGTATFPGDAEDAESLLRRARTALNALPSSDMSRFRQYSRELSAEAARRFEVETALKNAIEGNELELHFQPRVSLGSAELTSAEALLRWNSARVGTVPPEQFIPIAEDSGLIVELGDWVIDAACAQIAGWRDAGLRCPEVSINVSSHQLRQPGFCTRIETALRRYALNGSCLNVEITERSLVDDIEEAIEIMARLRSLDVTISIDDFGTGFSSLSYLARMPVQVLKIDRSFVQRICQEQTDMTLVLSIIAMGSALGLTVVAEGVETQEQLRALQLAGCDEAQGFLISQPLPPQEFAGDFLARSG